MYIVHCTCACYLMHPLGIMFVALVHRVCVRARTHVKHAHASLCISLLVFLLWYSPFVTLSPAFPVETALASMLHVASTDVS